MLPTAMRATLQVAHLYLLQIAPLSLSSPRSWDQQRSMRCLWWRCALFKHSFVWGPLMRGMGESTVALEGDSEQCDWALNQLRVIRGLLLTYPQQGSCTQEDYPLIKSCVSPFFGLFGNWYRLRQGRAAPMPMHSTNIMEGCTIDWQRSAWILLVDIFGGRYSVTNSVIFAKVRSSMKHLRHVCLWSGLSQIKGAQWSQWVMSNAVLESDQASVDPSISQFTLGLPTLCVCVWMALGTLACVSKRASLIRSSTANHH